MCFSSDFGVQQLVSQFYYLYTEKKYTTIKKNFHYTQPFVQDMRTDNLSFRIRNKVVKIVKKLSNGKSQPQVAILNAIIYRELLLLMEHKSHGKVQSISLPEVKSSSSSINHDKRNIILKIDSSGFMHYLVETLYYGIPQACIERFTDYYNAFKHDVKKRDFNHLVSEQWAGNFPTAIYAAVSQLMRKTFITLQHGASLQWINSDIERIRTLPADVYVTTGWTSYFPNAVTGGFSCRNIRPYRYEPWKTDILYISSVFSPYLLRFGVNPSNY